MFAQVDRHWRGLYSFVQAFVARSFKNELKPMNLLRNLLPTFGTLALTELIFRNTSSGYSVIVILLLSVVLYSAYQSGALIGVVSALLVVSYNFYLVAATLHVALLSLKTLESGVVIALVFPMLALLIGVLKERNEMLFQREQAARLKAEENAEQFRFMAESMPQKIFTTLPDGTNDYMNPQWREYTGSKVDPNWIKMIHPQDVKEHLQAWNHSLATGEPFQFEHRLRRADGQYIWHLTRATAMRDRKGVITLWIGSSTDIENVRKTKKLEANTARLIKQRAQLMELNKAKDEFISLASHQLRTPATSVKQYLNMILDGFGGKISPSARKLLATANASNERQLSVINDLLQVAQVDAGKVVLRKEPVNIDDLLGSIIRDDKSTFKDRGQKVKFEHRRRNVTVNADPTKLRMAIENVIDNASKYSPPNTTVTVRLTTTAGKVRVAIKDEGVGIPKTDIKKIFDKFTRIENPLSTQVGGNGLGLYWVQKVIELHDGTIAATSVLGSGSTFTITLPRVSK